MAAIVGEDDSVVDSLRGAIGSNPVHALGIVDDQVTLRRRRKPGPGNDTLGQFDHLTIHADDAPPGAATWRKTATTNRVEPSSPRIQPTRLKPLTSLPTSSQTSMGSPDRGTMTILEVLTMTAAELGATTISP